MIRKPVAAVMVTLAVVIPPAAAAAVSRWSVPHAQKTLLALRLAGSAKPYQVACHGTGRARTLHGVAMFTTFHCTVFAQQAATEVAVNVDIKVAGTRRYRLLDCQTASMPLTRKVCR